MSNNAKSSTTNRSRRAKRTIQFPKKTGHRKRTRAEIMRAVAAVVSGKKR